MGSRRWLPVLAPVVLVLGCDLLTRAYGQVHSCGYDAVDAGFSCLRACEEQRQQREREILAWEEACMVPLAEVFADPQRLDDANAHCRDQYGYGYVVMVCDDHGQRDNSEPNHCDPYREPTYIVVAENYRCPDDMQRADGRVCLCCDEDRASSCSLAGGPCHDDEDCCIGTCVVDDPRGGDDAGPTRVQGTCQ